MTDETALVLIDAINRLCDALGTKPEERFPSNELLSCSEAASLLGVSRQTISRYIKEGRLKKTSRGGRMGILKSDLWK